MEDGVYSIVSSQKDSKVLDVSKASINDKANIQLYQNNDTIAQQFHISYAGKGYYSIITEHSIKAFDVASASLKSGAKCAAVQKHTAMLRCGSLLKRKMEATI